MDNVLKETEAQIACIEGILDAKDRRIEELKAMVALMHSALDDYMRACRSPKASLAYLAAAKFAIDTLAKAKALL